jgi:hypothetical protein
MQNPAFTRAGLSDVRVIMMIYACSYGGVDASDGDGTDSSTQVPIIRCALVPVVMTYRARHLVSLFPEDPIPAALRSTEKPSDATAEGPGTYRAGSYGGSTVDRQVVKYCLSVAIVTGGRIDMDHSWVKFFLGLWFILFSLKWWDHIWYKMLDFLTVYCWREPVVSRLIDHNR